jgi:dTDP-4-amino-4,6-dideoxygalactose transaminase
MSNAMQVPLLDLREQYIAIKTGIDAAVQRVIDSQHFILGPEVAGLEAEIAAHTQTAYGVGMSSGTDALLAALMAVGVESGDEVVTTTYTFFATAGTIARLGARPVFVDIDPHTFNIDASAAADAITNRTRAIVPVHLYGRMADMDAIMAAASVLELPVIEDAAQAIGAFDHRGRQAGSVGQMGCFSFFPSKNLGGFGDGGMTVTSDAEMNHTLRLLRMHGMEPKYHHAVVGGNFRLDALQAAVLRVKLAHLQTWTEGRRRNAELYRTCFADSRLSETVTLPTDEPGHIYNQFVIRAPARDELQEHLRKAGIGSEIYYPIPMHLQKCFGHLGMRAGQFPEAERAARETLAIPIYPELRPDQIRYVVTKIADFYRPS